MASCLRKTRTILSMTKALVCRGMFLLHGLICIWRVTVIKSDILYWTLAGTLPLVVAETVYTLCKKKHGEWKWICPSVLLYLATSVPAIWFLELDVMNHRVRPLGTETEMGHFETQVYNVSEEFMFLDGEIQLEISLGSEEWCKILEQMLLLILIVGRWLLPKGEITREQLSQLLLVYIGMAADIIELFEAFKEDTVRQNKLLNLTILSLWTASLTQFTLVLTATKSKKRRTSSVLTDSGDSASCSNGVRGCCPTEVMSILLSVFLQDAPFLVLRLLLIFKYNVLSYSNIFFTSKNSLVLMLQIYRLVVLFTDSPVPPTVKRNQRDGMTSRSSGSNNLSLTSESEGSFSDGSIFDNTSDGSDWIKLQKFKRRRSSLVRQVTEDNNKTNSGSSFESDPNESMPGSSKMKRKGVLLRSTMKHDSDSSGGRQGKGKGKALKKAPGSLWVCRCQHDQTGVAFYTEQTSRKKGRVKLEREKSKTSKRCPDNGIEKLRKLKENRSKSTSPLPPPPESLNASDNESDTGNTNNNNKNNNNRNDKDSSSHQTVLSGKRSLHKDSPKSSPSRSRQESQNSDNKHHTNQQSHHQHRYHDDHVNIDHWHNDDDNYNKLCRRSSNRRHWPSIKGLQSMLTLLDEKGKYQTVVLKHAGDGSPVYVIDREKHNGHDITV